MHAACSAKGINEPQHAAHAACRADDPQKDLLDPALKGTTTVLYSAAKSKHSVKRIVLTSSIAGACRRMCCCA
jgi:nucleoside-diphosphate-sugar epimerase